MIRPLALPPRVTTFHPQIAPISADLDRDTAVKTAKYANDAKKGRTGSRKDAVTQRESSIQEAFFALGQWHDSEEGAWRHILRLALELSMASPELQICLSVPCIVGENGIVRIIDAQLTPEEQEALERSAHAISRTFETIQQRQPTPA